MRSSTRNPIQYIRARTVRVRHSFTPSPHSLSYTYIDPTHPTTMSNLFAPPPPPPTKLGLYRQLSPLAGVHVSPLQLGAMSIGDKWENLGMGAMNKESSFALLDAFYDSGGNFIDTANSYQDESSEELLGEWMEKRGIRDQIVLATKVRASCLSLLAVPVGLSPTVAWLYSIQRTSSELRGTSRKRCITWATMSRRCTSPSRRRSRNCARATSISSMFTGYARSRISSRPLRRFGIG